VLSSVTTREGWEKSIEKRPNTSRNLSHTDNQNELEPSRDKRHNCSMIVATSTLARLAPRQWRVRL
jgi:hypothetical protein